jgi:hypothetical protein
VDQHQDVFTGIGGTVETALRENGYVDLLQIPAI